MDNPIKFINKYCDFILIMLFVSSSILWAVFGGGAVLEILQLILTLIIVILFSRFGVYFILWVQLKNPMCPKKILIFFTQFFLVMLFIGFILSFIQALLNYKDITSLFYFLIVASSFSGAVRFKSKNNDLINSKS